MSSENVPIGTLKSNDDEINAVATSDINHDDVNEESAVATKKPSNKCKCCKTCCVKFYNCCKPCMTKYNPLQDEASRCDRIKYAFMCPPHGKLAKLFNLTLALLLIWGTCISLLGSTALPGGNIFGLFVLFVLCIIGGELMKPIKLPPLLGMLVVGFLLRNIPVINVAKDIDTAWSGALRSTALVVILLRAGLGLDPVALRKLSFGVIRLAFLPCIAETITAAVTSHLLLGFPWLWGLMLGFVLAAVSPAVVVPCMLALSEKGYGLDKGIPTLVIAAASVDDVLAISGFGVVLGITFSSGDLVVTIIKGPLEALLGLAYGIIFGLILWYIPHMKHQQRTVFQFILMLFGGLFAMFGSRAADLAGAGALGCLALAFVAAIRWRKEAEDGDMPVDNIMAVAWVIFQPLLFGLIGAEIDVMKIQLTTIGWGIAVLMIGLVIRMIVSFLAVFGSGLNLKEKLFIPFAWLPKATVQAAIGSVALDTARINNASQDQIDLGIELVTIAVLVILITAPLGALAITISAPRLLNKPSLPVVQLSNADVEASTPLQNVEEYKEK